LADTTAAYNTELERQRVNDALCKEFASVADPFSKWIVDTKDHITNSNGSLEEQLHYVEERIAKLDEEGKRLQQVHTLQAKMDEREVTNNRHTTLIAKVGQTDSVTIDGCVGDAQRLSVCAHHRMLMLNGSNTRTSLQRRLICCTMKSPMRSLRACPPSRSPRSRRISSSLMRALVLSRRSNSRRASTPWAKRRPGLRSMRS